MLGQQKFEKANKRSEKISWKGGIKRRVIIGQEYFEDAQQWYSSRYWGGYRQTLIIFLMFIVLAFTGYKVYQITKIYAIPQKLPFIMYFDDTDQYYPNIKSVTEEKHESIEISISRYLLERYVKLRESYTNSLLQEQNWHEMLENVRRASSKKVFSEFVAYMDAYQNPDSPILKYRLSTERDIDILSVKFDKFINEKNPISAIINFKATVISRDNSESKYKRAKINFRIGNLRVRQALEGEGARYPLFFKVTEYKVEDLK